MNRPMGVTIVAVLTMLLGVAGVIRAGMIAGVAGSVEALYPVFGVSAADGLSTIGIVALIVAVVTILVGIGLWMLQQWAWMVAIVVIVLELLLAGWSLLTVGMGSVHWLGVILAAVVLFYLLRDEVKSAFQA